MNQERNFTNRVIMVRPAHFGYNPETAKNNAFQSSEGADNVLEIKRRAELEFDQLVTKLRDKGIEVLVFDDRSEEIKPDAVFPNNWFTTHFDGIVVTYPMYAEVRRIERDPALFKELEDDFIITGFEEFHEKEKESSFLEGTGSMILDRENRIVYACLSQRTDRELLEEWAKIMKYKTVTFTAIDPLGLPVYHTNVIMTLGNGFAIICLDCIPNIDEKLNLRKNLENNAFQIIEISFDQVLQFAGNMLQMVSDKNTPVLAMSSTAYRSLTKIQRETILKSSDIVHSDIPTIEKYGGGSVRCMIAENFLQGK